MFAEPLQPSLDALVRNLDRDAVRSKRLIRQQAEADRNAFLRSALQILKAEMDSAGAQHLIATIVSNGLLLPALCDSLLSKERALALAQAAARLDPNVDVAVARTLADSATAPETGISGDDYARLMEVLSAISDCIRIFPSLVRLLRHPNPHIRSKAVLMIGRGNRSATWIRQRLSDTDPRIRANAAEALWGVNTEEAREVLRSLVRDSNNRVAGNAILGLYKFGDAAMISEIAALARHESSLFRATAAWVMGETGDPRFTEMVAALLREPNAIVRKRAFSALGSIRAAVGQATRGPRWRLSARLLDSEPGKSARRLMLGIAGATGGPAPALLPTQVFVAEEGEPVLRYRVVERPLPESMSVVFLVPMSEENPASTCLPWKRSSDLWASVYFVREKPASLPPVDTLLRFQSNPEAVAAALERKPAPAECLDLWGSLAAAVSPDAGGGKRHVLVFNNPVDRPLPPDDLRAAVAAGQAFVQVISAEADPVLEDFCRSVNGVFRLAPAEGAIDAYLALSARYEVTFQPVNPNARALRIRVHGPGMSAETSVAIPSPSPAGP